MTDRSKGLFANYDRAGFFCEMFGGSAEPAAHTDAIRDRMRNMKVSTLQRRAQSSDRELYNLGITFTVYGDRNAIDRVLPFDVIPRVLSRDDWSHIERGCVQRVAALNRFLHDIYHEQHILNDGTVPAELVVGNSNFRPEMKGLDLPHGTYVSICGIDLVRDGKGVFRVLEDNARTPSGVSYVVENRHLMMRAFPDLTGNVGLRQVSDYGMHLRAALAEIAPPSAAEPNVVLMSPGVFNSAYFEHVFLAREMGVPLVEGRDLVVEDGCVFMKTTGGLRRVDVIYRRVDDAFLDPEQFNPKSMLGVRGLFRAYRAGRVSLANAVGTGVADDKAVYAYMPRIVRYYLDEEPILQNVDTQLCREPEGLAYTLAELDECRARIEKDPANYISQPVIDLSVCPTLIDGSIEPRHVDLRPYIVTGKESWVLPGGLTRVALRKGSLVVNSSQGGGTKDTWVLE